MNNEIVFFINSLRGGGAEGVCVTLLNGFFEKKWQVTLLVLNLQEAMRFKEVNPNIECVVLNKKHARTSFFAVFRWLKLHQPKKILVFNYQLAVLLVILRFFSQMRFCIISRSVNVLSEIRRNETSFWHKNIAHNIVRVLYKHVDLIISQSESMKEDLITNYGFSDSDIIVINNPIQQKIENFNLNGGMSQRVDDDYILCIGRLEPQKAFHYAIEAFARIIPAYPSLRLKILGQGCLEDQLKQLAVNLGISDKIDFEGYREDAIPCYINARLTVLTSLFEGFPNVLVESIALGTPVVSFDCPSGPSEIIQDGVNGYLVRYQDMDHLVECLRRTLDREWDAKSIQTTAGRFSSAKIIDEYEKVLVNDVR